MEVSVPVPVSLPVFVLELGHRDGLEALWGLDLRLVQVLVVVQLLLAEVVDQAGADRVAQHVDGGSEPGGHKKRKLKREFLRPMACIIKPRLS